MHAFTGCIQGGMHPVSHHPDLVHHCLNLVCWPITVKSVFKLWFCSFDSSFAPYLLCYFGHIFYPLCASDSFSINGSSSSSYIPELLLALNEQGTQSAFHGLWRLVNVQSMLPVYDYCLCPALRPHSLCLELSPAPLPWALAEPVDGPPASRPLLS